MGIVPNAGEGVTPGTLQTATAVGPDAGSVSNLYTLDQPSAENLIKALFIQGNPSLSNPLELIYGGLRQGISFALAIMEAIAKKLLGLAADFLFFSVEHVLSFLRQVPGMQEFGALILGLASGGVVVNAANLIGTLAGNLFSFIPLSAIGHRPQYTPFPAGSFPAADSLQGYGDWDHDAETTRVLLSGSARVMANGTFHALHSMDVQVGLGQKIKPRIYVRWQGYEGSAEPIQIHLRKFNGDIPVGIEVIDTFAPPTESSAPGAWTALTGTYVVEEDVTRVRLRVVVTEQATEGVINFDDAAYLMQAHFAGVLAKWFDIPDESALFTDPDDFDPTDLVPVPLRTWVESFFAGLREGVPTETLTWAERLEAAIESLKTIPSENVLGHGGPPSIAATIQELLNQYVGGAVDEVGEGATLSDAGNVSRMVASDAAKGRISLDILGFRSDTPLDTGFLPTSESPISFSRVAFSTTTIAVTQSVSTIAWHRFNRSGLFGAVAWQGFGNADLAGFRINIWKMDTVTGDIELVHRSANIIADIIGGTDPEQHVYEFTDAEIMREAGDIYGAEFTVQGTGTHTVKGDVSTIKDQLALPRRFAATRNSGTGDPPTTIVHGDIVYSDNVPFIEFAVEAGTTPIPVSPDPEFFGTPGETTTPVAAWANWVDIIPIGGGRGGEGSSSPFAGVGGDNGDWNPVILEVGVDIKPGSIITVDVGAGGLGGAPFGSGTVGHDTTVTYIDMDDVEQTITAAGGSGPSGTGHIGGSPGDVTVNGVLYRGGGGAVYSAGSPPGGGGGGGLGWSSGFPGAPGATWINQRQD